jgi:WD40 repeat protein
MVIFTGHKDRIRSVAWSPDGTKIATACDDGIVHVWSSSSGSTLTTLYGSNQDEFNSVAWSPDGTKIATGSWNSNIWSSISYYRLLTLFGHGDAVLSVAWSPDGTKIATASSDWTARVWNSSTYDDNTLLILSGHSGSINSVAWSPDGIKIATASSDFTARLWSVC